MNTQNREPILVLRAKGPTTDGGRLPLADLLRIGKNVQTAVERVARVIVGQPDSRRPGRKPQEIARDCAMEVVALNRGSFEIALDLPRRRFEAMDLGVEAVEKLLQGWEKVNGGPLPSGYDEGVLFVLRDLGQVLGTGIDEIEAESRAQRRSRVFRYTRDVQRGVIARISSPVTNERTVEGRLLMADFRHEAEKCRIHPAIGEPITCMFDEPLEESVYDLLRKCVRVRGETREDAATGRITSIHIRDIEALGSADEPDGSFTAEDFWRERSLDELVAEQGVGPIARLEDVLGKGADLWESDEDFAAFLSAIETPSGEEG